MKDSPTFIITSQLVHKAHPLLQNPVFYYLYETYTVPRRSCKLHMDSTRGQNWTRVSGTVRQQFYQKIYRRKNISAPCGFVKMTQDLSESVEREGFILGWYLRVISINLVALLNFWNSRRGVPCPLCLSLSDIKLDQINLYFLDWWKAYFKKQESCTKTKQTWIH